MANIKIFLSSNVFCANLIKSSKSISNKIHKNS